MNIESKQFLIQYFGGSSISIGSLSGINNVKKIYSFINDTPVSWVNGDPEFFQQITNLDPNTGYFVISKDTASVPYELQNVSETIPSQQIIDKIKQIVTYLGPTIVLANYPGLTDNIEKICTFLNNAPAVWNNGDPIQPFTTLDNGKSYLIVSNSNSLPYLLWSVTTVTPTPTVTASVTPTITPTVSPTATSTATPTATASATPTVTAVLVSTVTPTATATVTPTITRTTTPTHTAIFGNTPTPTPTSGLSSIAYVANFDSGDISIIGVFGIVPTPTPTSTLTPTPTISPSITPTTTNTPTNTTTTTITPTNTTTKTPTPTLTRTPTTTPTPTTSPIILQATYNVQLNNNIITMSVTPNRNDVTYKWYCLYGAYPPSTTFIYDPRNDFLDTGIDLIGNSSRLTISATGTINVGWPAYPNSNGPNGKSEVGYNASYLSPDGTPFQSPHAALIGKIGINGPYFIIGSSYNQIATRSGRLYVGMYDTIRGDNSGSFTLNITSPTIGSQNLISSPSYIGKEVFTDTSNYNSLFSLLGNNSIYSGVSTNTLTISNLATTSYNGIYRCVISFNNKSLIVDVGTRYKL